MLLKGDEYIEIEKDEYTHEFYTEYKTLKSRFFLGISTEVHLWCTICTLS